MVLKNERDIRGSRGDENPTETRRETDVTKVIPTEPMIQGPCEG